MEDVIDIEMMEKRIGKINVVEGKMKELVKNVEWRKIEGGDEEKKIEKLKRRKGKEIFMVEEMRWRRLLKRRMGGRREKENDYSKDKKKGFNRRRKYNIKNN